MGHHQCGRPRALDQVCQLSLSRAAVPSSSDTNGSSSSSRSGSIAKARAMAVRRARPSESSPGSAANDLTGPMSRTEYQALRPGARAAAQGGHSLRRYARAAGAAPGTRCRAACLPPPGVPADGQTPRNHRRVSCRDAQGRRLAAAGLPDHCAECACRQAEGEPPHSLERNAVGATINLAVDHDLKRAGCASGLHVVQGAAPGGDSISSMTATKAKA